jgi:DNA-binding LacI/PurR family transcriptional regulator
MADVARLAGVSHQTVSRVLNDHPHVTAATRARVEQAIEQLGYRRNTAARALVTRRTGVLGVVSIGSSNYGPASTLTGIEAAARVEGYSVSFVSLEQVDRPSMQAALDHLTGAGVDGILVLSPTRSAVEAVRGLSTDVPVGTIGGTTSEGRPTVVIDQERGARLATAHLLDLGHRTVHHVRGPDDWLEAEARVAGWRSELGARAVPAPDCLVGDWSAASGYAAGRRLAASPDVTAVFVANDQMALGVLLALSEAGRAVPEDVSVVGFDDIPEAAYLRPPLTTVRQDFTELGRRCLQQLVALIDDRPAGVRATIEPELLVRASSAPAR